MTQDAANDDWPKYSDPGRILFHWMPEPFGKYDQASVEVFDYDSGSCLAMMAEGVGLEYALLGHLDLELEGYYVVEGITGQYFRGNWSWGEDDDEEWYFGLVRRASDAEVEAGALP